MIEMRELPEGLDGETNNGVLHRMGRTFMMARQYQVRRILGTLAGVSLIAACAPHRSQIAFDMRAVSVSEASGATGSTVAEEFYTPVTRDAAAILGCANSPGSPICEVGLPTAEEDSAFRSEGSRLLFHRDARCRRLGQAIIANEPGVRMYRTAVVRVSAGDKLYGVGHAFQIGSVWRVRVARKLDDLNDRTLEEKMRTLRHEMSHTIGATETPGWGWTAEDYASRCA
jgi:hypothetical protein